MIRRHVLRNSLLPTITVVATQTGYLIGGLVVVETLFRYQGIGLLIYQAAQQKDFPMLEAGVLTIGVVYMLVTIAADVLFSVLNPRIRLQGGRMSVGAVPVESAAALSAPAGETSAASCCASWCARRCSSSARSSCCSGSCARSSARRSRRTIRTRRICWRSTRRRRARTCSAPTSSGATCSRG